MRNYKRVSSHAGEKRKLSRRGVYAVTLGVTGVLVVAALTLSLTFGLRGRGDDSAHVDAPPVAPSISFGAPLDSVTLHKDASLKRLVYNDTLKQWRTHNGADFSASADSSVLSVADGTVKSVENTILEGVVVTVTHAEGYESVYKGLESAQVAEGDEIKKGDTLGKVGTMMSEKNDGPHLHLEMKKDGKFVSPTDLLGVSDDK